MLGPDGASAVPDVQETKPATTIPPALLAAVNDRQIVAFLGAGASMPPPTSMPSAQQLAESLVDKGYGSAGDDLEAVAEECWRQGGWQIFARALPKEEWRSRQPNDCHQVVAELVKEGLFSVVLTTNWDTMLEMALNGCRASYARIVRPEDLAVWDGISPEVVKLHGCIETPETIRARATDVDSATWVEDWAETVFKMSLRAKSVLFVGYSGASRATTKTIERVMSEEARPAADWLVGRAPFETAASRERTGELVGALETQQASYVEMDAITFFQSLREMLYPLLLNRPKQQAIELITTLYGPTDVPKDEVSSLVLTVAAGWAKAGQASGQATLRNGMPGQNGSTYIPLIPNATDIGRYWAWVAIAASAGVVSIDPESGGIASRITGSEDVAVLPVICRVSERRDQATAAVLATLAAGTGGPGSRFIGVVVGGSGPVFRSSPYDVARGDTTDDVVRGGHVEVSWVAADSLFDVIADDVSAAALQAAIAEHVGRLIPTPPVGT